MVFNSKVVGLGSGRGRSQFESRCRRQWAWSHSKIPDTKIRKYRRAESQGCGGFVVASIVGGFAGRDSMREDLAISSFVLMRERRPASKGQR